QRRQETVMLAGPEVDGRIGIGEPAAQTTRNLRQINSACPLNSVHRYVEESLAGPRNGVILRKHHRVQRMPYRKRAGKQPTLDSFSNTNLKLISQSYSLQTTAELTLTCRKYGPYSAFRVSH